MRSSPLKNKLYIKLCLVAAAIAALVMLVLSGVSYGTAHIASAEGESTVTIHVYDPAEQYSKLVGWIWIRGSSSDSGTAVELNTSVAPGEPFHNKDGSISARNIELHFDAAQTALLKSGKRIGFLICVKKAASGSWNDKYDKEGLPDVYVDLSAEFDSNNHADIYFVRKDTEAFTDIEVAKMALEKITSAKFVKGKNATYPDRMSIDFETSSPMEAGVNISIYSGAEEVASATVTAANLAANGLSASVELPSFTLDYSVDYTIKITGFPKTAVVAKTMLIDETGFIEAFENSDTQAAELGAKWTPERTEFRVWAPFATSASVLLYANGTTGAPKTTLKMKKYIPEGEGKTWGGIWYATTGGNQNGTYYTYLLNNNGSLTETVDPYAKACGANGARGMVVDLDSTDPAGWDQDDYLYNLDPSAADNPIVWEVHVKDFSSSADSGMKYKGKYLAFTEEGTTVPGKPSLKTGVNYLKDLGITYVHLNPVYDFATIDESTLSAADPTKDNFNWGYDPQNYNVPEGSYSTDPSNGAVRITEFKRMVQALHKAGIGVIMDVVYNHTYSVVGQALNDSAPGYYHRTDENGKLTDGSGCGNETASERTMFRKYMVESIVYWATEYHIDGFRFDLMGIHDVQTIKKVREALDAIDSNKGVKLMMYGEPWASFGFTEAASLQKRVAATSTAISGTGPYTINPNMQINTDEGRIAIPNTALNGNGFGAKVPELPWNVAVFNDSGRNGIRGDNWGGIGKGWANGTHNENMGKVQRMIEGGCGSSGDGLYTGSGSRNVAYAAAHDNYTMWDQLRSHVSGTLDPVIYDKPDKTVISQAKIAAASYLVSTGIVFFLAGDEIGRTKYGNENSYRSPAKLNQIVWSRQEDFKDLYDHFKALIAMRRANTSTLFSYSNSKNASYCHGNFDGSGGGNIKFKRTKNNVTLDVTLNASGTTKTGTIKMGSSTYTF